MRTSTTRQTGHPSVPRQRTPTGVDTSGPRFQVPQIEGLRGVAITLIVIYHIWVNRVSGGVDVFLFLSGFLITMSLVRTVDRTGSVQFAAFYRRIVTRIFPPALLVLVGVVAATILWLPQSRWREILADVVASALYVVNWRLANNAVDYLASQDAASPVQHYWSLAIQAQFYLLWPIVCGLTAYLAVRLGRRWKPTLTAVLVTLFAVSLAYSIYRTGVAQAFTYFDGFARLWEFALGGLVLLLLPWLRLTRTAAAGLSWLGLLALCTTGLVFRAGDEFPGWAALWPTLGAAAIVVAAIGHGDVGAGRLLRSAPLQRLGSLSYALFLWHWPVLICYLAVTGRSTASLTGGLLVVGISTALAVATKYLVEDRVRRPSRSDRRPSTLRSLAPVAASLAAVLVVTVGWHAYLTVEQRRAAQTSVEDYPGAAYLAHGGSLPDVPYRPSAIDAKDDRAPVYDLGCHQSQERDDVAMCEFGPEDADITVAVVGGSHSAHWVPAILDIAERRGWRVLSMTKSACRFSGSASDPSCQAWNENLLAELERLRPTAVFTTATTAQNRDSTPDGYLTPWQTLDESDIMVLAVRDTPWHEEDVPDCVATHGPDARRCGTDRASLGLDEPPAVATRPDLPAGVHVMDLTDYVCDPTYCPAVIGNVLAYHDRHHLSATYSRTLAPFLEEAIVEATGW